MGINTDAILCFGVELPWGEDGEYPWDVIGCEPEDWLVHAIGKGPKDKGEYIPMALNEAVEEELGVEVLKHCSSSCPMYILAVRGTVQRAWRGEVINVSSHRKQAVDKTPLLMFLEEQGIEIEVEPAWLLVSDCEL